MASGEAGRAGGISEGAESNGPRRRKLTLTDKLSILLRQARCPICDEKLGSLTGLDFDHIQALARGGADEIENIQAIHRQPCHEIKTRGTKATTRGSDIAEIAKTRRLERAQREFVSKLLAKAPGQPKLSKPKSRLRGRGFPKRKPQ